MLEAVERKTLYLAFAWVVALVATLGSLYYSEVRLFLPCELCWYQRIFMYPQAVILGLALWRQDFGVWPYSLALSLLGGSVSVLHLTQQWFPGLFPLACKPPVPCSAEYIPEERARLRYPGQAGEYYLGWLRLPPLLMEPWAFEEALRAQEEKGRALPLFLNAFHLGPGGREGPWRGR